MPSPTLSKAIAAMQDALCMCERASMSSPLVKQRSRFAKTNWTAFSAKASEKSHANRAT